MESPKRAISAIVDNPMCFTPAYLNLLEEGQLESRVDAAYRHLEDCDLCARYCRVNRRLNSKGAVCRTGERAVVRPVAKPLAPA